MSEKKELFGAAISWLRVPVGLSDEQKDAAIHVLEAAGKMDKKREKKWLNKFYNAWYYHETNGNQQEEPNAIALKSCMRLEAFLESLPEKEEK